MTDYRHPPALRVATSTALQALLTAAPGGIKPVVVCVDGFKVSVQASLYHRCDPRQDRGPWFTVECGFPSAPVPTWATWKEASWRDGEEDTEGRDEATVFNYVPIWEVVDVLLDHGGIAPPAAT